MFIPIEFNYKCQNVLPTLLSKIDERVYKIAKYELDNIRFGFTTHIDYNEYYDLMRYKSILKDIMYCSDYLCSVNVDMVISKVRKLTNSIC